MAVAGAVVGRALVAVREAAVPGVSTAELDAVAEQVIREAGAVPSFQGYRGHTGHPPFPGSICTSINDGVVHGVPSSQVVLTPGDLVSVDCGAIVAGWHGDSAWTFGVAAMAEPDRLLSEATRQAMEAGIAAMVPGNRLTDVSFAIETAAAKAAARDGREYGIISDYGGHGIGRHMHMEPFLSNVGAPGHGPRLVVGSVLAIEPMLTLGTADTEELSDGWTVVTADGSHAAHWEHTVAVTESGPRILTQRPDTG